ncbi:hypothetical protein SLA_6798 [Streptomyces laurentii]|uniref:Alkylmercury lyase n=1 Tax=Streptomyces laurentii TaxID=39478 RepID=A0A160P865_STRLU|nr:hypothetical protein SLA_6798 [Streptomyces laurentii]
MDHQGQQDHQEHTNHGHVRVEVLVVPDCPHQEPAEERVREALADAGLGGQAFTTRVIADEAEAERTGFLGSPSIHVDGRDPFAPPGGAKPALTCRLYRTPDGLDGVPDRAALRRAIETAARSGDSAD